MLRRSPRSSRTCTPVPSTTLGLSSPPRRAPAAARRAARSRPPAAGRRGPVGRASGGLLDGADLGQQVVFHLRRLAGGEGQPHGEFAPRQVPLPLRSEAHTSELQSLMRTSNDVFCVKIKKQNR